ncbi:MAG: hypothetical protein IPJ77_16030 [Planctomycetes bacterium]|nr:hypothetical protein [Planctomycetota bacterium]
MESLGFEFARPWALVLLALPLALLVVARLVDRPPAWYTGAFELWLRVARTRPDDARAQKRRVPPPLWPFALGLACAALAAAGPRPGGSGAGAWRVIVDRSPSMYLPASTDAGAPTRLERAAKLLEELLAGSELEWLDPGDDAPVPQRSRAMPAAWRSPPEFTRGELDWSAHDAAGVVWLTDRFPAIAPARASVAASGGVALPGLVGVRGGTGLAWDGERIRETTTGVEPACVECAPPLARAWSELVLVWARARELATCAAPAARAELRIAFVADAAAPARTLAFGRDGWRAHGDVRGAVPGRDARGPLAAWLVAEDGTVLVAVGPGRVATVLPPDLVLDEGEEAFAVSFARLFDACLQPARGVVALAERSAAGEACFLAGAPPGPRRSHARSRRACRERAGPRSARAGARRAPVDVRGPSRR